MNTASILQQELARGVATDLSLAQCKKAYLRLPVVPKKLYTGVHGGTFYINQRGTKIYLSHKQRQRAAQKKLPGVISSPAQFDASAVPNSVFSRVNRQLRAAHM